MTADGETWDGEELVRMSRYDTLRRYDALAMHYRAKVIREQVLPPEVCKGMIARLLTMPGGVRGGRLVWDALLPLVPPGGYDFDRFDVQNAVMENLRTAEQRYEFDSSAWWWRLRVLYDIPDPAVWVVEQAERKEKGWSRRLLKIAFGDASLNLMKVYQLVKKCKRELEKRKRRLG
ncbi:hypothetical protein BECAL_03434 [Bellilinea caldifistulae]|jgi:hypothetical protein|uniref:Uncharacterized protein n=1 Tax=Bellilinea caldifistulae TaxID=360411 RepID=A0A0P6X268_9CHLR|nr:hypothetical protein [Bellilinea caldifistulae]KPL76653.1 hypothetical protein AC812_04855 [Bellilinea caldifistulae]GAP12230.1 hypothetical protein BECAL_03434 [Bellilinea caldifistulae]